MVQVSPGELDDRVLGRTWTVRLDAAGRGSAAVRVSCSRPACVPERLATTAAGRTAAVAHLKAHLKAMAGPRAQAFCVCKAEHCHLHTPAARFDERPERGVPWRCGGPVVLSVVTDREGRWWRAMECCSRCAAATPGATTVATAPPPPRTVSTVADAARPSAAPAGGPLFSDRSCAGGSQMVPAARSTRQRPARDGRIAGHVVPHGLRPLELRDELTELGDRFRSYQQRTEPDLALLADLHTRKAAAFTRWADVTGDRHLRREAQRAEQAAQTARLQHQQRATRTTDDPDGDGPPAVARLLTGPAMWEHARSVLAHCATHPPLSGPQARLVVVMLTLRTAHTGTGNLVGQDLTTLGLADPKRLVEELAGCGWLATPASADDLLASRPEDPTPITIPWLSPGGDRPGPFTFGKKTRPKLSRWAQKIVADKKLRTTQATAAARMLALVLATQTNPDGHLGPSGHGIPRERLASLAAATPGELPFLLDQLSTADWLTDHTLTGTHLAGRLSERVLPLTCPLPAPVPEEHPV